MGFGKRAAHPYPIFLGVPPGTLSATHCNPSARSPLSPRPTYFYFEYLCYPLCVTRMYLYVPCMYPDVSQMYLPVPVYVLSVTRMFSMFMSFRGMIPVCSVQFSSVPLLLLLLLVKESSEQKTVHNLLFCRRLFSSYFSFVVIVDNNNVYLNWTNLQ